MWFVQRFYKERWCFIADGQIIVVMLTLNVEQFEETI